MVFCSARRILSQQADGTRRYLFLLRMIKFASRTEFGIKLFWNRWPAVFRPALRLDRDAVAVDCCIDATRIMPQLQSWKMQPA